MYKYKDIKALHLEVTDKCNASCSQCLRNNNGVGVNPHLALTELVLDDIKKIFPVDFIKQLKRMYMCGNYGDPIVAGNCLEIYKYFRKINPTIKLSMNTNGSLHSTEWWRELGEVFGGLGEVKFGIDGLADTHHIYRQGTDWNRIIDNAKAFMDGGGRAVWEYIIFEHNEHQVEKAKKMSQELGFSRFVTKKTWRFFSNAKNKGKKEHVGTGRDGKKVTIKKPKDNKNINIALKKEGELSKKYGSMKEYLKQTEIDCKVKKENSIYVSAEGLVLPCCWLANQLYIAYLPKRAAPIWKMIKKIGGVEKINAKKRSLQKIVSDVFFQKIITNSWNDEGRLEVCAKICGIEFDPFKDQYK